MIILCCIQGDHMLKKIVAIVGIFSLPLSMYGAQRTRPASTYHDATTSPIVSPPPVPLGLVDPGMAGLFVYPSQIGDVSPSPSSCAHDDMRTTWVGGRGAIRPLDGGVLGLGRLPTSFLALEGYNSMLGGGHSATQTRSRGSGSSPAVTAHSSASPLYGVVDDEDDASGSVGGTSALHSSHGRFHPTRIGVHAEALSDDEQDTWMQCDRGDAGVGARRLGHAQPARAVHFGHSQSSASGADVASAVMADLQVKGWIEKRVMIDGRPTTMRYVAAESKFGHRIIVDDDLSVRSYVIPKKIKQSVVKRVLPTGIMVGITALAMLLGKYKKVNPLVMVSVIGLTVGAWGGVTAYALHRQHQVNKLSIKASLEDRVMLEHLLEGNKNIDLSQGLTGVYVLPLVKKHTEESSEIDEKELKAARAAVVVHGGSVGSSRAGGGSSGGAADVDADVVVHGASVPFSGDGGAGTTTHGIFSGDDHQ